jgi:hypothetical protein
MSHQWTLHFLIKTLHGITIISPTKDIWEDLRNLIIKGIREADSQSQNIPKTFDVQKDREEGCTEFLIRLKDQMRKYSGLNMEEPLGRVC